MSIKNWYPFYPTDFDRDTMMLTTTDERGFYRDFLDLYWMHEGDILEKNVTNLAKKRGFSAQKAKKTWKKVAIYFPVVDGKLTNKKMDLLMLEAARKRDIAVANGRAGGIATARQSAKQPLDSTPSSPTPTPTPTPESRLLTPDGVNNTTVVESPMDWAAYFVNFYGYQPHEAQTAKTMPMFATWVDAKATTDEIHAAMQSATATLGEQPGSPIYLDKIFRSGRGAAKNETAKGTIPRKEAQEDRFARLAEELAGKENEEVVSEQ